jgi:hypothetical protein
VPGPDGFAAPAMELSASSRSLRPRLGALLLVLLLGLSLAGFGVTRALRVSDDVVNSVVLSPELAPGESAEIEFNTTESDPRADVLITDTEDRQVRALALGVALPAGRQRFRWDGTRDDGTPALPGEYGIRVILGDAGRDIKPPGRIRVIGEGS